MSKSVLKEISEMIEKEKEKEIETKKEINEKKSLKDFFLILKKDKNKK